MVVFINASEEKCSVKVEVGCFYKYYLTILRLYFCTVSNIFLSQNSVCLLWKGLFYLNYILLLGTSCAVELRELGSAFSNFEFCRTFQLNFCQTWVCKIDENWTDSFNKDVQAFVFCSEPVLHERANLTSWYIDSNCLLFPFGNIRMYRVSRKEWPPLKVAIW